MSLKFLAPTYNARVKAVSELLPAGGRLLDIGCSAGEIGRLVAGRFSSVIGVDLSQRDIRCGTVFRAANQALAVGDVTHLPLQSATVDAAICIEALEHIPDDAAVLAEASRVLRPGGVLLVSVPHARFPFTYDPINALLGLAFGGRHLPIGMWGFGHLRLYSLEELEAKLGKAGFKIVERRQLTRYLAGLCENYLSTLLQFLVKPDSSNRGREGKAPLEPKPLSDSLPVRLVSALVAFDERLFAHSRTSVGLLIVARKH